MRRNYRHLLILTGILSIAGNPLFAQNSGEEGKEEEELPVYVGEETLVMESKEKVPTMSTIATRIPVPIQLTPASIGVVTAGLFRHQSGMVLGDALRNVSGVNIQTVFGVTDFFIIRGFDSLSSGLVLTDGASEPEATFYNLYNLDRVEVLKGPGAFLYGGNPLSGSVNLSRKQPIFSNAFQIGGSYGPYKTVRGTLDANRADIDRGIAWRVNALRQVSDSYRDDKASGSWAVNPAATWRPDDKTTITANFEYVTSRHKSDSGLPIINGAVADVPRTRSYQSPFDASDQDIFVLASIFILACRTGLRFATRSITPTFHGCPTAHCSAPFSPMPRAVWTSCAHLFFWTTARRSWAISLSFSLHSAQATCNTPCLPDWN